MGIGWLAGRPSVGYVPATRAHAHARGVAVERPCAPCVVRRASWCNFFLFFPSAHGAAVRVRGAGAWTWTAVAARLSRGVVRCGASSGVVRGAWCCGAPGAVPACARRELSVRLWRLRDDGRWTKSGRAEGRRGNSIRAASSSNRIRRLGVQPTNQSANRPTDRPTDGSRSIAIPRIATRDGRSANEFRSSLLPGPARSADDATTATTTTPRRLLRRLRPSGHSTPPTLAGK